MSRLLPPVGFLREQVRIARALAPEQPGVIRLSCFDAEEVLAKLERELALLEAFAIDASLLLDTLPAHTVGFQKMAADAVADRISEVRELLEPIAEVRP